MGLPRDAMGILGPNLPGPRNKGGSVSGARNHARTFWTRPTGPETPTRKFLETIIPSRPHL